MRPPKGIIVDASSSSGKQVRASQSSFRHPEFSAAESLLSLNNIFLNFLGGRLKILEKSEDTLSSDRNEHGTPAEPSSSMMTFLISSSTFSVAIPYECNNLFAFENWLACVKWQNLSARKASGSSSFFAFLSPRSAMKSSNSFRVEWKSAEKLPSWA